MATIYPKCSHGSATLCRVNPACREWQRRSEVSVTLLRPGAKRGRKLGFFTSVRQAEKYIGKRERIDPTGVHRGDYTIDATERADAAYQRLRNRGA